MIRNLHITKIQKDRVTQGLISSVDDGAADIKERVKRETRSVAVRSFRERIIGNCLQRKP